MKLAKVYKKTPHIFKRFYMYESVYSIRHAIIISAMSAKEFNTKYTSNNRLTEKVSLSTQP